MLEFLPELRELSLVGAQLGLFPMPADFSGLAHLETAAYRGSDIWLMPTLPAGVRRLDLSQNPSLRYRDGVDTVPAQLEALAIFESPRLGNAELLAMLGGTRALRELDVGQCPKIDVDSLDWLLDAGLGARLEVLSLQGSPSFGDQVTREMGRLRALRRLNVGATRISGVGVANLVNRPGSRLEWLGLDYCPNVGRDAVELAIAAGVQVSNRVERIGAGGRRVRYPE